MYKNIGWTLGNDCPCNCKHCYSMQVREKGMDLSKDVVDRIIGQIITLGAETVNFGGNEPIYTNGLDYTKSMLPYIIDELTDKGVKVGLTTSGLSAILLEKYYNEQFVKLNDIDISIDSPFEDEHNNNRGANIFKFAIQALELCNKYDISCSVVLCAMSWNFNIERIEKMLQIAKKYKSHIRINMLKPVEAKHIELMPTNKQIYDVYYYLIDNCYVIDMSDPVLAACFDNQKVAGCSCGISSLRINSITPAGEVSVSPCVYMHHHKVGNILKDNILDIVNDKKFKEFVVRKMKYNQINGCQDCDKKSICRGGCAAAAYWYNFHKNGISNMLAKDPYCVSSFKKDICNDVAYKTVAGLVHQNYLCTWIGTPKN